MVDLFYTMSWSRIPLEENCSGMSPHIRTEFCLMKQEAM